MLAASAPGDLWVDADYLVEPDAQLVREAATAWVEAMVGSDEPFREWMAYWWHGHFATSLAKVRHPLLMIRQTRMLRALALGNFRELVRAVSIDGAMLVYLDGASSVAGAPNENYSRELMELFTIGVGSFDEDDVTAAAHALTGWVVRQRDGGDVSFAPRRHDATPRRMFDKTVNDVDSVVDAVTGHPNCAPFIAGKFARHVLGPEVAHPVLDDIAQAFRRSDLDVTVMVRRTLEHGLDGARSPAIQSPFPWLVRMLRATAARPRPRDLARAIEGLGQGVWNPPSVAGWPSGAAWFSAGSVVARTNVALALAASTPVGAPAMRAAAEGPEQLALVFDRPEGFGADVRRAIESTGDDSSGLRQRLAIAMADPEGMIV